LNAGEAAGRWGFQGRCDIPYRTLENFVKNIVENIKPDLILWTGDNPPHNPWGENYKEEIYEITKLFIDLLLNKYNYTKPVFPSIGNHEEDISDQYNPYSRQREAEFLKAFGNFYKPWLSDEQYRSFIKNGYYTKKYLDTKLRIISINCFLCDNLNFFLIENPTDPHGQFAWMEETLRQAEKDGEYVFIIGHIPPGDSTYTSECSKRYQILVDRFQNIIRGHFYGHTHYDEFRVLTEYYNKEKVAGVIFTAPSLTTYSFQNPSFRIYELESKNMILKDYHQYRLNLTEANLNPDNEPEWKIAYSAKQVNTLN
jgi:sphingomyelin phosphodiesterase